MPTEATTPMTRPSGLGDGEEEEKAVIKGKGKVKGRAAEPPEPLSESRSPPAHVIPCAQATKKGSGRSIRPLTGRRASRHIRQVWSVPRRKPLASDTASIRATVTLEKCLYRSRWWRPSRLNWHVERR